MFLNCGVGEDSWAPWTARRSNQSILKEISPVYSLERLMLKLKLQYLSPDAKSWLIWKDSNAGKDWGQEEKGMTEDEMDGWHHWLKRHESEHTQGDSEGQESLVYCASRSCKELDTTKPTEQQSKAIPKNHWILNFSEILKDEKLAMKNLLLNRGP